MPKYRSSLKIAHESKDPRMSRRRFIALIGWGAAASVGGLLGAAMLGFLHPNALKIPSNIFSLGRPADVFASSGRVFLSTHKAFVEVAQNRVRCMAANCTHLGCTVNAVDTGFICPWHDSTYDLDGRNTGGPASSPLVYYKIFRGTSGDLLVDKGQTAANPADAWYSTIP